MQAVAKQKKEEPTKKQVPLYINVMKVIILCYAE
jgi:hypothetical protein